VRIPPSVQHWIVPVAVLAAWEGLGRTGFLPHYLPPPTAIVAAIVEVTRDGELPRAMAISLFRVSIGFALGAGAGMLVGLGAGLIPGIRHFFDPLVAFLFAVPKIAFLPIFLLLFGLGDESKIAIVAFSCFFPVFIASRHAVLSVSRHVIWSAQNMGAPPLTMLLRVFLPAAAPELFSGARIGLAHCFVLLFAAELMGLQGGLGALIVDGDDAARFDLMFAGIVTFALLGYLGDRLLMAVRRVVLRGQIVGTVEQLVR
jgi:ABC-type nitrate/sulfonate/bicarbonate transport system permease component